jgi:hypothetical protein
VIGAAGYFGRLLIDDLLHHVRCNVVLGGRRLVSSSGLETRTADLSDRASLERALNDIDIVICTAGPYQQLPLFLVELCLQRGIHYIDLADNRDFVQASPRSDREVGSCPVGGLCGMVHSLGAVRVACEDSLQRNEICGVDLRFRWRRAIAGRVRQRRSHPCFILSVANSGLFEMDNGTTSPAGRIHAIFYFHYRSASGADILSMFRIMPFFPDLFAARTVEFRAGSELAFLNGCLSLLRRTRKKLDGLGPDCFRELRLF